MAYRYLVLLFIASLAFGSKSIMEDNKPKINLKAFGWETAFGDPDLFGMELNLIFDLLAGYSFPIYTDVTDLYV